MPKQNAEITPISFSSERETRHLALCGLMGTGKTAVGEILANELTRSLVDNDESLKAATGKSARELGRLMGIQELHRLEAQVLERDLKRDTPAVITAAASTITDAACRSLLSERAFVVWLDAAPATSAERMSAGTHRPAIGDNDDDPEAHVRRLREERAPLFRSVADLVVDTTRLSVAETAAVVLRLLGKGAAIHH